MSRLVRDAGGRTEVVSDARGFEVTGTAMHLSAIGQRLGLLPDVVAHRLARGELGPSEFLGKGAYRVSPEIFLPGRVSAMGRFVPEVDEEVAT